MAKPPLKELGIDQVSGKAMVIKDGRFGPYVTDGETNASLRKADDVDTITDERASELLADRRERGPAPKKAAKKAVRKTTKKATKGTAKKTAKKPAKKAAARKAPAKAAGRAVTPAAVAEAASTDEPF